MLKQRQQFVKNWNHSELSIWQVFLIALSIIYASIYAFLLPLLETAQYRSLEIISFLVNVLLIALPLIIFTKKKIEFRPVKHSMVTPIFFIFGCIVLKAWFSQKFYQNVLPNELLGENIQPGSDSQIAFDNIYVLLGSLVSAPLVEETIFRLCLLGSLALAFGRLPALIISSAIFAMGHLGRVDLISLVPYCFYGFLLGTTYLLYGFFWAIAAHFFFNFQAYLISKGYLEKALESQTSTIVLGLLAVSGLFIFFQQIFKNRRDFGKFSKRLKA